jgi:molybdopterin synthase sulfur carrier subunit
MYIYRMILTVKTFGISRDILGGRTVQIEINGNTVAQLRDTLATKYPEITRLNSLFIAVNKEYAADDLLLTEADEIALIPPVSGG